MSSRDVLLSALGVIAFGSVVSGPTIAEARTTAYDVCTKIVTSQEAGELQRHVTDPDCGAVAIGRMLELRGVTRIAPAMQVAVTCLYKPDDPRYRLDPRCPPLIMPTPPSGGGSGAGSQPGRPGGYPG